MTEIKIGELKIVPEEKISKNTWRFHIEGRNGEKITLVMGSGTIKEVDKDTLIKYLGPLVHEEKDYRIYENGVVFPGEAYCFIKPVIIDIDFDIKMFLEEADYYIFTEFLDKHKMEIVLELMINPKLCGHQFCNYDFGVWEYVKYRAMNYVSIAGQMKDAYYYVKFEKFIRQFVGGYNE